MWLAIRLAIFCIAFCIRALARGMRGKPDGTIEGRTSYCKIQRRRKSKEIEGYSLGVELPARLVLRMHRESSADRLFKSLGIAREVQTGDDAFDCLVYVACDHAGVHELLTQDGSARAAIRNIFESGCHEIRHDGRVLWIARSASREPDDDDRALLGALVKSLGDLESRLRLHPNPFVWRPILCEATAWGILGFALASFPLAMDSLRHSLAVSTLLLYGVGSGAAVGALGALGVVATLRGSSRARLVIVECLTLLLFSMPVIGIQSVADINARSGEVTSTIGERRVLDAERRTTGSGKRRRTTYRFTLETGPAIGDFSPPSRISVSPSVYYSVRAGEMLEIVVSRGSLGLPWVEYRAAQASRASPSSDGSSK